MATPLINGIYYSMMKVFKGNSDASVTYKDVVRTIKSVKRMSNLDDKIVISLATAKFEGAAESFVDSVPNDVLEDIDLFENALRKRFLKRTNTAQNLNSWMSLAQKVKENVQDFYDRFVWSAKTLNDAGEKHLTFEKLRDSLIRDRFILGLNTSIARNVMIKAPKTLETALEFALEEEMNEELFKSRISSLHYVDAPKETRHEKMEEGLIRTMLDKITALELDVKEAKMKITALELEVKEVKMNKAVRNSSRDRDSWRVRDSSREQEQLRDRGRDSSEERKCYNCDEKGHYKRDCPLSRILN